MNQKKDILILTPYFYPAFKAGGPVRSLLNLTKLLSDEFNFYIITGDRDLGDNKAFPDIEFDTWIKRKGYLVYYRSANNSGLKATLRLIRNTKFDILYLNSFFSFNYSIFILILKRIGLISARKVVLAPRGELAINAVQLKGAKKRVFIRISRILGLHKRLTWHITSKLELQELRDQDFIINDFVFAENVASLERIVPPPLFKSKGKLKMAFLSRITRKKNLHFALDILSRLNTEAKIEYIIYGPVEDDVYWAECKRLISQLPSNIEVIYKGSLPNELVNTELAKHHLFFFPTLSENYGHVIHEALSAGCLLLISTETPWRNLQNIGIGWDIELDKVEAFVDTLAKIIIMDDIDFQQRRTKCKRFLDERTNFNQVKLEYKELFKVDN